MSHYTTFLNFTNSSSFAKDEAVADDKKGSSEMYAFLNRKKKKVATEDIPMDTA
jgi:hypothetical protein